MFALITAFSLHFIPVHMEVCTMHVLLFTPIQTLLTQTFVYSRTDISVLLFFSGKSSSLSFHLEKSRLFQTLGGTGGDRHYCSLIKVAVHRSYVYVSQAAFYDIQHVYMYAYTCVFVVLDRYVAFAIFTSGIGH